MSEVTTTKPINLAQLATETGDPTLSMRDQGGQRVITAAVTQAALQAAVDAHAAIDEASNRTTLEQQAVAAMQNNRDDITSNNTYDGIVNPTNAQVAARVKILNAQSTRQARQLNGIIRLLLNNLDGTD